MERITLSLIVTLGPALTGCFHKAVVAPTRSVISSETSVTLARLGFGSQLWLSKQKTTTERFSDGTASTDSRSYLLLCERDKDGPACRPVAILESPTRTSSADTGPTRSDPVPEPTRVDEDAPASTAARCSQFVRASTGGDLRKFKPYMTGCTKALTEDPSGKFAMCVKLVSSDEALKYCAQYLEAAP